MFANEIYEQAKKLPEALDNLLALEKKTRLVRLIS